MGSMMTGSITTTGGIIVVVLGELVFSGVAGVEGGGVEGGGVEGGGVEGGGVEGVRGARGRVGIIVSVVVVVVSPS
jgi:hypothetical protein